MKVLFSTRPEDLELYGKPMARNIQIWTREPKLLLDGPHASLGEIERALRTVRAGGVFGYRFVFPAIRVGKHEVYWHRPLVAYRDAAGEAAVLPDAPLGYLTAYDADKPRPNRAVELWPRVQRRPVLLAALAGEDYTRKRQVPQQVRNVRKLTHAYALYGARPLPVNFARRIMGLEREGAGERWLASLPAEVAARIREISQPPPAGTSSGKRGAHRTRSPTRARPGGGSRSATGRRSLRLPRRRFATGTPPTPCSTRRRSESGPTTNGTSNAWGTTSWRTTRGRSRRRK